MSNLITSKELLVNQTSFPTVDSAEYKDFWINERNKCLYGIVIDGVYLPGFLYWHVNYFKCQLDVNSNGKKIRLLGNPVLRDNEWKINQYIKQGEEQGKGVLILGTRRLAKSIYEESYIAYNATFFKGTENVIAGLNQPDIAVLFAGVMQCFRNLPLAFKHGVILKDPKSHIILGKKLNTEDDIWSSIFIRNLDGGKNTEILAGLTPFSVVIDEIGKGKWLECFDALIPGLGTPSGWRCSPLCFGTSGDMEKAGDAKLVFENPDSYGFLAVEIEDENLSKPKGIFFSGHYAHDFAKDDTPLSDFLGVDSETHPNLAKINIQVTNFERAEKQIDEERQQASKSDDPKALLKRTMYHPKNTHELFLSDSGNTFPIDLCRAQLAKIEANSIDLPGGLGSSIELYQDLDGIVKHKSSNNKPVIDFPVKAKSHKEGAIIMYEPPKRDGPFTLYVAGIDPYAQNVSTTSDSLGAIYIYKRIHTIAGEAYRDIMVAHYVGRPKTMNTWFENARLLLKFYNAYALCENDNITFIQYMIGLNEASIYLSPKPQFLKDLMPNSQTNREYGINATVKLVNHIHEDLKQYLTEVIDTVRDPNGNVIKQVLGVSRILDPMLLKEIIAYTPAEGNYDRLRAFCLALSFAKSMTGAGPVNDIGNNRFSSYRNIKKTNSLFHKNIKLFKNGSH